MAFSYIGYIFKMRTASLIVIFLICSLNARSQSWIWDSVVERRANTRLCKDQLNNIFLYSQSDTILQKLTANGALIWQLNFPQNLKIKSVTCSPDSSIYLVGLFRDTLQIATHSVVSYGGDDICIARFNQNGAVTWLKKAGSKHNETVGDICMNGTDFVITGSARDTIHFGNITANKLKHQDFFVAKYYNTGLLHQVKFAVGQFNQYYGTGISEGFEVETDPAGNIIVLAGLLGSTDIDTSSIWQIGPNGDHMGTMVLKFDINLALQWNYLTTNIFTLANNLKVDKQGIIYAVERHNWGYSDYSEIIKISSAGTVIQILQLPNTFKDVGNYSGYFNRFNDLVLDSCDNLYFAGNVRFWSHSGSPGFFHMIVGQYSPLGNLNWMQKDSSFSGRAGVALVSLATNHCFVTGNFSDSLTLKNKLIATDTVFLNNNDTLLQGSFFAHIKTTVGLPTSSTPISMQTLCSPGNTTLAASSAGAISWYTSSLGIVPVAQGPVLVLPSLAVGSHTYYAEARTCSFTTGRLPITVTVNPNPTVTVAGATFCEGNSFTISPAGANSYSFSSGSAVVTPSVSSSYTVIGENNNCRDSAICNLTILPRPQISITKPGPFVCAGKPFSLSSYGATSYTWSTGAFTSSIVTSLTTHTTFSVTGAHQNGCINTATVTQLVMDCTVGLEELAAAAEFKVYPNPSSGNLIITSSCNRTILIYNSLNQLVKRVNVQEGENSLDLSLLDNGVYLLYNAEIKTPPQRLIINH